MDNIAIIQLSQSQETPTTTIHHPNFDYRFAYARSADSQAAKANGQDYLEIHENQQRLVFVLCDGVGQSFLGDFAARFLGKYLSDWLWHNCLTNNIDVLQIELKKYLQNLTNDATEQLQNYQLPPGLPELTRQALEAQRRYGSQSMFVAGMIDVKLNRVVLASMGNPRIRLWASSIKENAVFDNTSSRLDRWSTLRGLVYECKVFLSPLRGLSRLAAYSDGLERLDKWKGYMPGSQELNSMMSESNNSPYSDDISFFEIMLPTSLKSKFGRLIYALRARAGNLRRMSDDK